MNKVTSKEKLLNKYEINTEYYIIREKHPYFSIDSRGSHRWYQNEKWHRVDGPAFISKTGYLEWCQNGKFYRDEGPAIIDNTGNWAWYRNGKCHRVDGPAIIYRDGSQFWHVNGKETTKEKIEFLRRKYFYRWRSKMNF